MTQCLLIKPAGELKRGDELLVFTPRWLRSGKLKAYTVEHVSPDCHEGLLIELKGPYNELACIHEDELVAVAFNPAYSRRRIFAASDA